VGKFNLRFGARAAAAGPPRPGASPAGTELRHTLRSLCELALAADPAKPEPFALGPALRRLGAVIPPPMRVRVEVDPAPLAPVVAAAVYATICEALANVVGHADARRVVVTVRPHGPTVQVSVSDDGDGGARPVLGGGIVRLAARAAALGGLLHVDSPPGSGTHLALELPRRA
jgi:signal transduction histidine kinase